MSITKHLVSILPLSLIVIGLLGYNLILAQWTGPTATAPGSNTPAPINVSSITQSKLGNFNANILSAATSTWSPRYCDELGANCWDPATGAPGAGADTITVGGRCFEPAFAVRCVWEWGGTGSDETTYIVKLTNNIAGVCGSRGRTYRGHEIILATCNL